MLGIMIKKELTNRTLVANEFTFKLYERIGSVDIELDEKTNDADGIVKFDKITYPDLKSVGPHTYVIKEVKGNLSGVSYFEGEKVVTVDVDDNGSGELSVTHKDATESNPVVITNTYNANGEVTFAVTKNITGNGTLSQDKEFLNRLDEIIMFKPLTKENIRGIINLLLQDINKRIEEKEISLKLPDTRLIKDLIKFLGTRNL